MHYDTASTTRQGDRDTNQDRCAIRSRPSSLLLLLADGMGGHPRGELAAQVYIDSLLRAFGQADWPVPDPATFLAAAMNRAHADIITAGNREQPPVNPMTTGVACLLQEDQACWTYIGDSRLYLFRHEQTLARTRDHSLVQAAIERGEWPEDEREQHPLRHIVTRSLGGDSRVPDVELPETTTLQPGDTLLLCSDGLWAALPEDQLARLAAAADLSAAVQDMALQAELASRPFSDNVTLVACRLH